MTRVSRSLLDYLPPNDQKLVADFFGSFARAECRLKELGYIRRGREDAQADWDAFASDVEPRFRPAKPGDLKRVWMLLTENPPRKQVVRDGALAWKATPRSPGLSDAAWGLLLVRRVRNNLFHGAKFMLGGAEQFGRDRELVAAALTLLEHAMRRARPRPRVPSRGRAA
jgi:hypothetical protein